MNSIIQLEMVAWVHGFSLSPFLLEVGEGSEDWLSGPEYGV